MSFAGNYVTLQNFVTILSLLQGSVFTKSDEVSSFNTLFSVDCCSYVANLMEIY